MLALLLLLARTDGRIVRDHIRRDVLVRQRSKEMKGPLARPAFRARPDGCTLRDRTRRGAMVLHRA